VNYLLAWSIAFCWTLAFETPVYALALRNVAQRWWTPLALALAVNLATHPVFSAWVLARSPGAAAIALAEVGIALSEAALVYVASRPRCSAPRALAAGSLANAGSYLAGEFLLR